jgi:hypothetical protein
MSIHSRAVEREADREVLDAADDVALGPFDRPDHLDIVWLG